MDSQELTGSLREVAGSLLLALFLPLLVPLFLLLALWSLPALAGDGQSAIPEAGRERELVHLVRQDCGSCHGLTLRGGLGPALLPATMADKPASSLVATILHGRPGTPMPPFTGLVSAAEAEWIVARLLAGFPEH